MYIAGEVIRIMPAHSNALYKGFLDFYKLSKTYVFQFNRVDSYYKFNKVLGQNKKYEWDVRFRAGVIGLYFRFYEVMKHYDVKNYCDAFYRFLEVDLVMFGRTIYW